MSADSDHTLYMYPLADEAASAAAAAAVKNPGGPAASSASGLGDDADAESPAAVAAAAAAAAATAADHEAAKAAAARDLWMASQGTGRRGAPASANATNATDTVIVATVPDSGHWQHWLDRTSHVVMQVNVILLISHAQID